jgi:hypothetical protein
MERRVRSNLLEVLHTTSHAGVDFFLIYTVTTRGKRQQCSYPTDVALGTHLSLLTS